MNGRFMPMNIVNRCTILSHSEIKKALFLNDCLVVITECIVNFAIYQKIFKLINQSSKGIAINCVEYGVLPSIFSSPFGGRVGVIFVSRYEW